MWSHLDEHSTAGVPGRQRAPGSRNKMVASPESPQDDSWRYPQRKPTRCTLSTGDSSGGVFIQVGSTWKLAGSNYSSDGLYSLDGTTNTQFFGALVDQGGFTRPIARADGRLSQIKSPIIQAPSSAHAFPCTAAWINSIINFLPGSDLRISNIAPVGADIQINLATGSKSILSCPGHHRSGHGHMDNRLPAISPGMAPSSPITDTNAATAAQTLLSCAAPAAVGQRLQDICGN